MTHENKEIVRGSAKLFASKGRDQETLKKAIGLARGDYEIKWWWKFGQPAIDLIRATLEVPAESLGATVAHLMRMNEPDTQVTVECAPASMAKPDVFNVNVSFHKAAQ